MVRHGMRLKNSTLKKQYDQKGSNKIWRKGGKSTRKWIDGNDMKNCNR